MGSGTKNIGIEMAQEIAQMIRVAFLQLQELKIHNGVLSINLLTRYGRQ